MTGQVFVRATTAALDDLRVRLHRYRPVPRADVDGTAGFDPDLLTDLIRYWATDFDWRAQEDRIAGFGWVQTRRTDVPVRAVLSEAAGGRAPVVVLLHGWPDSVLRFERIFPHLRDVSYVAPALPGFPFSAPVAAGLSSIEMADAVAAAMTEFGVDRYTVSPGDVGCDVAEALAARHPNRVASLHLTDVSQYHFLADLPADLDDDESAYVDRGRRWQAAEGGYMHQQSTRPDTLAVGLGDSPAGLAAWIVEKLVRWTDCDGDLFRVFSYDEVLTWVTAYWLTGTIATSFGPYATQAAKHWPRVEAPTVFTLFGHDLVNAPRRFANRKFDVVEWRDFDRGGHFAAWERPDDYVWGLRRALLAGGH
ncbi:epoxide hydrolase family protein [Gordonia sp. HS-NH1]|uniref:epoxide hydrolase family protein n=1 Tax=Gordonia sp. HS-NH1 TaxID=1435068 RepID=UPI0006E2C439|nr:epoxide hydrolase family protein [Gordonia sp. HS-NH1]